MIYKLSRNHKDVLQSYKMAYYMVSFGDVVTEAVARVLKVAFHLGPSQLQVHGIGNQISSGETCHG